MKTILRKVKILRKGNIFQLWQIMTITEKSWQGLRGQEPKKIRLLKSRIPKSSSVFILCCPKAFMTFHSGTPCYSGSILQPCWLGYKFLWYQLCKAEFLKLFRMWNSFQLTRPYMILLKSDVCYSGMSGSLLQ